MKWKLLFKAPGGHRYFEAEDGRVAVADDSGATPDKTEDGVLYLDKSRPIKMGKFGSIPVLTEEGEQTSVLEVAEGAILVANRFKMLINAGQQHFDVAPVMEMPS
jgi:hypothetical protein